jgi:hypothetical protein
MRSVSPVAKILALWLFIGVHNFILTLTTVAVYQVLQTHNLHSMFTGSLPIDKRLERYTPYEFTADLSELKKGDRAAIKPLIQAAKLIEKIYIRQAWAGNEKLKEKLEELGDKKLLTLFNMYKGPWVS